MANLEEKILGILKENKAEAVFAGTAEDEETVTYKFLLDDSLSLDDFKKVLMKFDEAFDLNKLDVGFDFKDDNFNFTVKAPKN